MIIVQLLVVVLLLFISSQLRADEHEVFVLQGNGIVMEGEQERLLKPGTAVFVPGGVEHQFRNTGTTPLKFLCLIPHLTGDASGSCAASCGCE